MTEEWRAVAAVTGRYEVSNYGRVRVAMSRRSRLIGRIISQTGHKGYARVTLETGTKPKHFAVHRLVALAFLGPGDGLDVNHLDGDRSNNWAGNLEWVTEKENTQHALRLGLIPIGERHPVAKLTAARVLTARQRHAAGETWLAIATDFGVAQTTLRDAASGRHWKHVS